MPFTCFPGTNHCTFQVFTPKSPSAARSPQVYPLVNLTSTNHRAERISQFRQRHLRDLLTACAGDVAVADRVPRQDHIVTLFGGLSRGRADADVRHVLDWEGHLGER